MFKKILNYPMLRHGITLIAVGLMCYLAYREYTKMMERLEIIANELYKAKQEIIALKKNRNSNFIRNVKLSRKSKPSKTIKKKMQKSEPMPKINPIDVTKKQSIKELISILNKENIIIDVIVISVSIPLKIKRILDLKWNEVENQFRIQVMSLFQIVHLLKPQFQRKHKTKIIVILTELCIGKPSKGFADYIIGKYGLLGLSKVLAVELAEYHSTVNMITPGMVETKLIDNLPPKLVEIVAHKNPLKRIATTIDVANVISFLASEESDYLNGINIPVNGGNVLT